MQGSEHRIVEHPAAVEASDMSGNDMDAGLATTMLVSDSPHLKELLLDGNCFSDIGIEHMQEILGNNKDALAFMPENDDNPNDFYEEQ